MTDDPNNSGLFEFMAGTQGTRKAGAVILAFSLIVLAVTGGWPSWHSLLHGVLWGAGAGLVIALTAVVFLDKATRRRLLSSYSPAAKRILEKQGAADTTGER